MVGVNAFNTALRRATCASPISACWIRTFVEFEIAYAMQSCSVIIFPALPVGSWPQASAPMAEAAAVNKAIPMKKIFLTILLSKYALGKNTRRAKPHNTLIHRKYTKEQGV